jgi:MoaA/NifB/PqqE/SkfB family radical SAM enzyme
MINCLKSPPRLLGYSVNPEDAWDARDKGRMLSLRLETTNRCNLNCQYCGTLNNNNTPVMDMPLSTARRLIREARNLGAQSVVIIGAGEPTLHPRFRDIVQFVHEQKMIPVIFSNLIQMGNDHKLIEFLWNNGASIIGKRDSMLPEVQDSLTRTVGSTKLMEDAFEEVRRKFNPINESTLRLGLSFVISKRNISEVKALWEYCRSNAIYPNLEIMVPTGRAQNLLDQIPSAKEWSEAREAIVDIDTRFGFKINTLTPLPGTGCLQCIYSVYVTVYRQVWPCAGVQLKEGPLITSTEGIQEAVRTEIFRLIRDIDRNVQGKCSGCEHSRVCFGCRGMAFIMATLRGLPQREAIFAEDPCCSKNVRK